MKTTTLGLVFGILAALFIGNVKAQDHHGHPPQDQALHEKFYSTWTMPDAPHVSCCHNEDCKPASSKFEGGHWLARWADGDDWTQIPDRKIEENRDSPDGRSHMCGRRYFGEISVFCFVRGNGS